MGAGDGAGDDPKRHTQIPRSSLWDRCPGIGGGVEDGRGGKGDGSLVRRGKVLIFSGCTSHPATGSLQPVAIGAMVEVTKPSEPSRQTGRMATRRADWP